MLAQRTESKKQQRTPRYGKYFSDCVKKYTGAIFPTD